MKKGIAILTVIFSVCFIAFLTAYLLTDLSTLFTLAVTFGTIWYHFAMRLAVGTVVNGILHNKVNYKRWWFQPHRGECGLFKFLGVKKWKKYVSAYDPSLFDMHKHTVEEILMATCQAEIVHEIIMVFSLLPVLCILWLDGAVAFIVTSVLSFLFDSIFVIVQRYNRPRLFRLLQRQGKGVN